MQHLHDMDFDGGHEDLGAHHAQDEDIAMEDEADDGLAPLETPPSAQLAPEVRDRLDNIARGAIQAEKKDAADVVARVLAYLSRRGGRCLLCPEQHHPNYCEAVLGRPKSSSCYSCFGTGHRAGDASKAIKELGVPPPPEAGYSAWKERKQRNSIINGCTVVYREHAMYDHFQPCTTCWLKNPFQGPGNHDCGVVNHYHVRHAFLVVWWKASWREEFEQKCREEKWLAGNDHWESWRHFMEWGVYKGTLSLQNAWRVVAFVIDKIE